MRLLHEADYLAPTLAAVMLRVPRPPPQKTDFPAGASSLGRIVGHPEVGPHLRGLLLPCGLVFTNGKSS